MKFNIPDIVTALCSEPLMILSGHIEPFIATCVLSDTKFVENLSSKTDLQNTAQTLNVVNVQSVLSNNSNTDKGLFGYKDIAKDLSLGNDDPSVAAHVMYIKSPGGSVTGLAELADLIHASPKPVYAYIDELGASAAYYIAAAATEIWTSTRSSLIGNIGSVIRTIDLNGILEKLGAKSIEVYGTDATNKDLGFTDAKNGNPEKLRKLLVDPANDMFTQDLKKYRPSLSDEFMDGSVYYSEAALQNGLVDHLGTFQDMLNAISLNLVSQKPNQTNTMSKTVTMEVPEAIAGAMKVFGAKVVDTPTADTNATNTDTPTADAAATGDLTAQIEQLTAAAAAKDITISEAQVTINSLTAAKATAEASLAEANQTINTLKADNPAAQRSEARQAVADAPAASNTDEIQLTPTSDYLVIN